MKINRFTGKDQELSWVTSLCAALIGLVEEVVTSFPAKGQKKQELFVFTVIAISRCKSEKLPRLGIFRFIFSFYELFPFSSRNHIALVSPAKFFPPVS